MSKDIRAGGAFVELLLKTKSFNKKLGAAGKTLTRFGATVTAAVIGPLAGAATLFASVGDSLQKMSARTGVSAQALSELKFAAQQSGTGIESVEKGIRGMNRMLVDAERGLSTAVDNLTDLGLTLDDIKGKSPEQQFEIIAEKIASIEDPSRRAGLAMKIFGRSGADLLPMLAEGVEGMNKLRKEARELGITLSDEDATAAAALTDAMGRLQEQFKTIVVQIGAAIAGPITEFADQMKENLRTVIDFIKANRELVFNVAKAAAVIGTLGGVLVTVGITMQTVAVAIGGVTTAMAFVVASPMIVGLGLVAAAFAAIALEASMATDGIAGIDAAIQKLNRSKTDRDPAELRAMITRFEQLAAKTKLTNAEQKEARKIIRELRIEYGDLAAFVDRSTGEIVKSEKTLAQLRAAQAGQSRMSLNLQVGLAELAIEALKAEGAEIKEITKREKELATLREKLNRTDRIIKDASPFSVSPTKLPDTALPDATEAGKAAGEEYAQAFLDLVRAKINAGAGFLDQAIGGAAAGLDDLLQAAQAMLGQVPNTAQMQQEVFASFSSAALVARGRGGTRDPRAELIASAIERADERQAKRDTRLLRRIEDAGGLRA